ncbi:O-antigen ligase family protein [bacterium]|nr:O-antigen ligase family protein [bacterium]
MWQVISWSVLGLSVVFGFLFRRQAFYLLLIFIPFYAFLITYLGFLLGVSSQDMEPVRLLKEGLVLGIFFSLLWYWLFRGKKVKFLLSDVLIGAYLIFLLVIAFAHHSSFREALFGLRYNFFFYFYYFVFRLFFTFFPAEKERGVKTIFITAILVFAFAVLQFFVLPKDFLCQFGYIREAMSNFDASLPLPAIHWLGNSNIARVQSFFAGPNQLASFCLIVLFLALGGGTRSKYLNWVAASLSLLVLGLTFSRSAWLGGIIGLSLFVFLIARTNIKLKAGILGFGIGVLAVLAYVFKARFYEIFIRPSSSAWHWVSLRDAWHSFLSTPWGIGLGKVGPASQWLKNAFISENYYLQIGLETGWLGLVFFLLPVLVLLWEFWQKQSLKTKAVFCLFLSLLVSSFFLHTLADGVLAIYLGLSLAWAQTNIEQ